MDGSNHPSKRRRLENGYEYSSIDSSEDELAASSDHDMEQRRAGWSAQNAYTSRRRYGRSTDSGSPDELAVDTEAYWGRDTREQSIRRDQSRAPSQETEPSLQSKPEDTPQRSYDDDEDATAQSVDRTPSPSSPRPPPPPPPMPDRVNYKQKFVLKGHLRGVSSVQFSPDGSKIASGGKSHLVHMGASCDLTFELDRRRWCDQGLGYSGREAHPYV
jgi:COMPASS component SWD3